VIIPVKSFRLGKQRLAAALDDTQRSRLGRALAAHVAETVEEAGLAALFVTGDPEVAAWATMTGFPSLPDPGQGLNAAAAAGAEWADQSNSSWIVLHSDLPLLQADDLREFADARTDVIAPSSGVRFRSRQLSQTPDTARLAKDRGSTGSSARHRLTRRSFFCPLPPAGALDEDGPFVNPGDKRVALERWLDIAVTAVDPEALTADALSDSEDGPTVIIAIGKAAAGMCHGAHRALGPVSGVCVTNAPGTVPDGIDLLIGDHPIPGDASFEAGKRVLEVARAVSGRCVALISGGGSALCEQPVSGVDQSYIQEVNALLLDGGASIEETNLVRRHLSAIKCGGVARAVRGPLETYVVSDVGGAEPGVVASGPTIPTSADPTAVKALMRQFGIPIPEAVWDAMNQRLPHALSPPNVTVLADGKVAARAVADAAQKDGFKSRVSEGWITGPIETALEQFFAESGSGVTVAVGEPTVDVRSLRRPGSRATRACSLLSQLTASTGEQSRQEPSSMAPPSIGVGTRKTVFATSTQRVISMAPVT